MEPRDGNKASTSPEGFVDAQDVSVVDGESDRALGESAAVRTYLGSAYDAIAGFGSLLHDQGVLRGLIGPREVSRLWERHLLNSAAVVPYLPETGSVADIGSGAGLPGIVIAMLRPRLQVLLLEPMERRTTWLAEVADQFDLTNVEIKRGRAEEYHGAIEADVVTSRAVAGLGKLAALSIPLLRPGGEMVALKGRNVAQEIEPARKILRRLKTHEPEILHGGTVEGVEPTTILRVRRR